ncbi:PREDICTED: high mobility group nucleosome-binding domain-containing protein 3 isoform X2 [Chinchilla lanigera]|uniref:high mobility group nucleosome-binding domain-containing protein 3 isoform X2 n=1 Tax=Chinchilla lanigera TaxID=34839 RepID=UPI00038EDF48|nr:PREDICTED: high mobility group nucleosome-binding domain-containing protein 3 isoform X2 [Chinchilla lanigera]
MLSRQAAFSAKCKLQRPLLGWAHGGRRALAQFRRPPQPIGRRNWLAGLVIGGRGGGATKALRGSGGALGGVQGRAVPGGSSPWRRPDGHYAEEKAHKTVCPIVHDQPDWWRILVKFVQPQLPTERSRDLNILADSVSPHARNLLHQNLNLNQEKHLLRKNLEQRLTEALKGRRKKSRKLERKVLHRLRMVKLKLKRHRKLNL